MASPCKDIIQFWILHHDQRTLKTIISPDRVSLLFLPLELLEAFALCGEGCGCSAIGLFSSMQQEWESRNPYAMLLSW